MANRSKDPGHFGLNDQQRRCLDLYRVDPELNQTKAYQKAYPESKSKSSTWNSASRLISSDSAQSYLKAQAVKVGLGESVQVTVNRVTEELKRGAFLDTANLFEDDGVTLRNIKEMEPWVRRAITSIKVKRTPDDKTKKLQYEIIEVKVMSKERTLELLGKHLVMFTEKFVIESEEAMHIRVRAEIVAEGEEILALVVSNAKRQLVIDAQGAVPDDRPESPEETVDNTDPTYLAGIL